MARTINEEIVRHESRLMQDKSPRNFIVSRRHRETTKRLKETRQRKGKERSEGRGVAVTARTDRGASGIPPGDAKVREAAQTTPTQSDDSATRGSGWWSVRPTNRIKPANSVKATPCKIAKLARGWKGERERANEISRAHNSAFELALIGIKR